MDGQGGGGDGQGGWRGRTGRMEGTDRGDGQGDGTPPHS